MCVCVSNMHRRRAEARCLQGKTRRDSMCSSQVYVRNYQRAALSIKDSKKVWPDMSFVVQMTMSLDSALANHRSADISVKVMPPM